MSAPETSRARVIRRLESEGWVLARHGAEHDIHVHPALAAVVSVPRHRTLSVGVARQIAKTAEWN